MRIEQFLPVPPPSPLHAKLLAGADRHHAHLVQLVDNLRSAGLSEGVVAASVRVLTESYASEQAAALSGLAGGGHHE